MVFRDGLKGNQKAEGACSGPGIELGSGKWGFLNVREPARVGRRGDPAPIHGEHRQPWTPGPAQRVVQDAWRLGTGPRSLTPCEHLWGLNDAVRCLGTGFTPGRKGQREDLPS